MFDAIAATASRRMGFKYVWASIGSFVIYFLLGVVAATLGGIRSAAIVGLFVGIVDATIGEMISSAIGPLRAPLASNAVWSRALIVAEVVALTVVSTCLGAVVARR